MKLGLHFNVLRVWLILFTPGKVQFCENIHVPQQPREERYNTDMTLWLQGHVAGEFLNQTQNVNMDGRSQKLFIQTDKFLYQPGQTVRLRLLTVHLTNISVSTTNVSNQDSDFLLTDLFFTNASVSTTNVQFRI